MGDQYSSGNWHVKSGKESEFIERWTEFLQMARDAQLGLVSATLIRDDQDPKHFVSLAEWEGSGRADWQALPEFMERYQACQALCDDSYGSDYERTVAV
jgi:heme-degrading monooxygenase HmoA